MSRKKKIEDLTTDEFFQHGLDSDASIVSGDEEENASSEDKNTEDDNTMIDSTKKEKSHKKQLTRLKDKDPEFYKFLQDNDTQLLEFSDSDAEGDLEESEDEKEETKDEVMLVEKPEGTIVTNELINKWKKGLKKNSVKSVKSLMRAFHSAVETMSPADEEKEVVKKKTKYIVSGSLFNNIVALCLKNTVSILEKHLDYTKGKNVKKVHLPSSSKQWNSVKIVIKTYLTDILQLLRQLTDATMLSVILRHCQLLCPYYACFPKTAKMFLKRLVRMWSSSEEHVRVLAFLCIRRTVILFPNLFDFIMKKMYLSFVRSSKFVTLKSQPLIVFMRNSMVEISSLNQNLTYRHAFVYIRQLAIHLRNAITIKKQDSHQVVYNWQFINSLLLWAHVIGELYGVILKPLVYPIVQITLGVIRLIPAARYYPIRFKCVGILNFLSEKTRVYIPTAAYILEVLECEEFQKKPKSSEKPPEYNGVLKFTKPQLQTKGFHDVTTDIAFELLLQHFSIYSYSIAFPELVFPVCHRTLKLSIAFQLKRLVKRSKSPKLCKDMKVLINKLESYSGTITKARSNVDFAPKDIDKVEEWENAQKAKSNSLQQFLESWKKLKEVEEQTDKDNEISEEKKQTSKKRKAKTVSSAKKVGKKVKQDFETAEDIVEDFELSDSEDE